MARTRRLNSALVALSRGHEIPISVQASLAGFPCTSSLSDALHSRVPDTPLVEKRVKALAQLLKFEGPIFCDEERDR